MLENLFPQLGDRSIPDILAKLLLHVNYHDEIRRFRLVSQSWRNFIDQAILANPKMKTLLMEKEFVDAWTKRPPKKTVLKEESEFQGDPAYRVSCGRGSYMSGEYIFVRDVYRKETCIYKTFKYIGCIKSQSSMKLAFCKDYFVDLKDIFFSKTSLTLKAFIKQTDGNDEYLPSELPSCVDLTGMNLLALRTLDESTIFLICSSRDNCQLILLNIVDQSVKRIDVSGTSKLVTYSQPRSSEHFLAVKGQLDIDERGLVLFKSGKGVLRLVDHVLGEEVWVQSTKGAERHGWYHRVAKTSVFTALMSTVWHNSDAGGRRSIHFYDNGTGQLLTCFSVKIYQFLLFHDKLNFFGPSFWWSSDHDGTIHSFNVSRGSIANMDMIKPAESLCQFCGRVSTLMKLLEIVMNRIALLNLRCKCGMHHLVAVDLLKRSASLLHKKGKFNYTAYAKQGRVLCLKYPSSHEVVDVGYKMAEPLPVLKASSRILRHQRVGGSNSTPKDKLHMRLYNLFKKRT